jgi:hypothetical protein
VYKLQKQVELPNDVDMEIEISKFKNGKEIGHDHNLAKMIKEGGKEPKKALYELI